MLFILNIFYVFHFHRPSINSFFCLYFSMFECFDLSVEKLGRDLKTKDFERKHKHFEQIKNRRIQSSKIGRQT